jgi:aspartokinase/homoserine dehydrogenase 1
MKVAKFGGSSVGSAEAIGNLVEIIRSRGFRVVVVSALSGVTDKLIALGHAAASADSAWPSAFEALVERHRSVIAAIFPTERAMAVEAALEPEVVELRELLGGLALVGELSPRSLDLVMSFGERLSAKIVAAALADGGVPAKSIDARTLIVAEGDFGSGRPNMAKTRERAAALLRPFLDPGAAGAVVPVITGFIAASEAGETFTLGRGGSDYTASILAAAVDAEEVEIWTDVDGILTADPRKVSDAFSMESLSYLEAMELSHFGAKVIYPPTIRPAYERGIPIRVLNSFNPSFPGTVISSRAIPSRYPVRGISSISSAALLRMQGPGMIGVTGIANRLFGCLARKKINIILISQASSEQSICIAVAQHDSARAVAAMSEEFASEIAEGSVEAPIAEGNKAILAVVGERMRHSPGISGRVFYALGRNGVNVSAIAQGSSELNISSVVDSRDEVKALNAVHEAFFLAGTRSVNVFIVGKGLIGGTLLEQVRRQRTVLLEDYSIRLNVAGIADRSKMLLRPSGIDLSDWRGLLASEGEKTDLGLFVERIHQARLPNAVFVDCTADSGIPALYLGLLRSSVAVVTPNKRGNSGSLASYRELAAASRSTGTPYLYETTVGGGLPVISTLHDLQVSGDRITRIEAVLSGTMSYILSNYRGDRSFASLVREAKSLGYTEPDPRDDLKAADSARKSLILARELGYSMEYEDIAIESILPPSCVAAEDVDAFFESLEDEEASFRTLRDSSHAQGKSLVYAASIEEGRIKMGLREAGKGDALYGLRDAENAIAFFTERYSKLPLVVRGPGAGAEVTAGGLFADIVRVAKSLV